MIAILKKTVGPNFRAGDIIKGERSRIKRLNEQGIVVLDHSLTAMIGNIITFITSVILIMLVLFSFYPEMQRYIPVDFSMLWALTFLGLAIVSISINIAYFTRASIPYLTYFLSFTMNIIGGVLIMIGHESTSRKYQPATISASATIILFSTSSIAIAIAVLANINYNIDDWGMDTIGTAYITWLAFIFVLSTGIIISIGFDINYNMRRKRYISFLKRKNATIEYKTKALNSYRAYLNTGNAEEFMKKNIDLLEATLEIDRGQVEDK